ncbi:hypothetical protein L226DRAFT_318034 [Lentinus tigrinus ALCF2SS1-7]|uniref:uncharacterized protein n=1 Tax=Lentinus tigrinus ALCF2SS1-7 TaxID=1328758 RepID=UPI00116604C7|nr:hypothetical protein L226DRAFT_318034 [Lentinus tigrinus ALCF2SS1-7]
MILLDGLDKHDDEHQAPKLVAEASTSYPVARAHTPTPSLPDYEASQAQLQPTTLSYPDIQKKRTRRRRCRKYTIIALATYFILTVVIGIPIIVVKLKRKTSLKSNPYQSWEDNSSPPPKSINLGDAPLRISAAKACNSWNVKDRPDGSMFVSELDYHLPANGSLFLNTNISYASNATYLNQFAGSLLVAVNDDVSEPDGVVHVTMHHSSPALGNNTNVCMMETGQGSGLYVFAPKNLSITDALIFNITLLLPRNNTSPRNFPQLLCHLPHFQHTYNQLDPQVTFDSVIFGGAMSGVYVESIQASSAVVKASMAEIRGKFKVSQQLSLETVSAPINVDAHLYNDGNARAPTFMHLTTGNSVLNANVTLYVPPNSTTTTTNLDSDSDDAPYPSGPQFLTHAETFNAPLNMAITHEEGSGDTNFRARAMNNLGTTRVSLDSRYAGTFDVNTMFAQADVLTWDGTSFDEQYGSDNDGDVNDGDDDDDGDDDGDSQSSSGVNDLAVKTDVTSSSSASSSSSTGSVKKENKVRLFLPATTSTASTGTAQASGRCLEYDLISSSEIRGWVGIPPRPSGGPRGPFGNQSHIDVISSLNGAQLILQP